MQNWLSSICMKQGENGADESNMQKLFRYANGVIVGTSIKEGGVKDKKEEVNLKPYEYCISLVKTRKFVEAARIKK